MRFWSPTAEPAGRMPGTTSTPVGAGKRAQTGNLLRRADKAANSGSESHPGQQLHLLGGRAVEANGVHLRLIHAGQHGDRQQFRQAPRRPPARHARQRAWPGRPAACSGHHAHAQRRGRAHRCGHGVGNVVQLEVQEDRVAAPASGSTTAGPAEANSSSPTLNHWQVILQLADEPAAEAASGTSSATIRRLRASPKRLRTSSEGSEAGRRAEPKLGFNRSGMGIPLS